MLRTVVGLFDNPMTARAAAQDLTYSGIPGASIRLMDASTSAEHVASTADSTGHAMAVQAEHGATIGALADLMLAAGELPVPSIGPSVLDGWLATTLLGAGVGAATGGSIGSSAGTFRPAAPNDAPAQDHRTQRADEGATVLSITTSDTCVPAVIDLLHRHRAGNIHCSTRQ